MNQEKLNAILKIVDEINAQSFQQGLQKAYKGLSSEYFRLQTKIRVAKADIKEYLERELNFSKTKGE